MGNKEQLSRGDIYKVRGMNQIKFRKTIAMDIEEEEKKNAWWGIFLIYLYICLPILKDRYREISIEVYIHIKYVYTL